MWNGYKTYITVACGVVTSALYGLEYIDINTFTIVLSICGFSSVASLRHSIKELLQSFK